jgi:TonB family protein
VSAAFSLALRSLAPLGARWSGSGSGWGAWRRSRWASGLVVAAAFALLAACGGDEPVVNPAPISPESPFRYPIDEWDAGVEGEVVVMVHVTDVGDVDSVYVLESSGRPALDSAALTGARQLEFAPGRRGDRRIAMWAKLPVRFQKPEPGGSGGEG